MQQPPNWPPNQPPYQQAWIQPQAYYYPQQVIYTPQERPINRGMKTTSIIRFVFSTLLQIISFFPLIGFIFGILSLCLAVLGFIFLCLI
jgi:hypothetical protein